MEEQLLSLMQREEKLNTLKKTQMQLKYWGDFSNCWMLQMVEESLQKILVLPSSWHMLNSSEQSNSRH